MWLSRYMRTQIALIVGLVIYFVREIPAWFVFVVLFLMILTQAGFLAGAPHLTWPRPHKRRPMIVSKVVAALAAALLTYGLCASLVSLADLSRNRHTNFEAWILLVVVLCLWAAWCVPFLLVWAGEWLPMFRRTYKYIFAGTALELLITLPIDIQVRKRTSCYCEEGSFLGLVIGITVAVWSFGPGLILLYLNRKFQRRIALGRCQKCGYDLRGLSENRCPECGTGFVLKSAEPTPAAARRS